MTEFFPFNYGKVVMIENDWENLKCVKCGGEMELEKVTEFEEVKSCKDCGRKVLFIKKLREGF